MAILLALLAALAYGSADFTAGLASRRIGAGLVTALAQGLGLVVALSAVALASGSGPRASALLWGAVSGVGNAVGTLALYRGLAVGQMTIVATLSAVLTAALPVVVGLALGNALTAGAWVGVALAGAAILLVSAPPRHRPAAPGSGALVYGGVAGGCFALLFVALDRAGTHSGAWPVVSGQVVAVALTLPVALRGVARLKRLTVRAGALVVWCGLLSGIASLLFLSATGHGELAIVAVVTALYPAITVVLARTVLAEGCSGSQAAGLVAAVVAIVLVTVS